MVIFLFSVHYQVNSFIKEGFGPDVRPFSIGLNVEWVIVKPTSVRPFSIGLMLSGL